MIIVGLTGNIGVGKSTTLKCFYSCGFPVFSSDIEVAQSYYNNKTVKSSLKKINKNLLCNDGYRTFIDKKIISKLLISGDLKLQELEDVIFPMIKRKIMSLKQSINNRAKMVVVEVPLLFEAKIKCDVYITVDSSKNLLQHGKNNTLLYELLNNRQFDIELKKQMSDYVIYNNTNKNGMHVQVIKIIKSILQ